MTLDAKLVYFFNGFTGKSQIFDAFIIFFASYLQYFLIAAFLIFLFFSAYSKRKKLYIFWTTAISAVVARFVIVEIIRFFYHRPRPFAALQIHQLILDNNWSFPSGHSAFFFAMASAIYFYNKKWGARFFIAAILMNISRVIAGAHYPTDILGGAIIGIAIAYIIFIFSVKYMSTDDKAGMIYKIKYTGK